MRSMTDNEKLFNIEARKYGIKSSTATQFDKNDTLKKAFNSFIKSKNFKLADNLSNLRKFDTYYLDYFEEHSKLKTVEELDPNKMVEEVKSARELFELTKDIKEIACSEYHEIHSQGFIHIRTPDGSSYEQDFELCESIERWHRFRRGADKIKQFIQKRYPRWDHASKKEKEEYREDLKDLIEQLSILGISDNIRLRRADYFINNYSGLNQIKKFKVDILLSLQLPLINSSAIATKIVENSKFS